jgi:hypothetical protein
MEARIVANLNNTISEFLERAARSCAYRSEEFLRDELREQKVTLRKLNGYLDKGVEAYHIEKLASLLEERIRDVFYELFEIERSEDASDQTNDAIKNGLFGIQKAVDGLERHLHQRGGVAHHRELEGGDPGKTHYVDDDCPGGHREPGDDKCVGHFRCQCQRCREKRISG